MKNIKNIVESKYAPSKLNIWLKGDRLYIYTAKGWIPIDTSFGDVRKKEYADYDTLRFDKPTDGTIGVDKSTGKFYIYSNVTGTWTALDDEVIEGTYLAEEDTFYTVDSDEVITPERGKLYTDYPTGDIYRYHRNKWEKISSPKPSIMNQVTWLQLKDMRDESQLIPGNLYRITDYQCTTTQENTQSAGHQFDIVLLALSANKLAEEGWAMMHDNIYDVTFNDGVTKKCYINIYNSTMCHVIDIETMFGYSEAMLNDEVTDINEINKTATCTVDSIYLDTENLPYNYFQNSNLSAWKVWYCLDNDKSRFAWADLGSIQIIENGSPLPISREPSSDTTKNSIRYYAWLRKGFGGGSDVTLYTTSETPLIGDSIYQNIGGMIPTNTVKEVINNPEGTGVIYRLIDEWGNDVPYDFKNIQYVRALDNNGQYDSNNGVDTWCYTFNIWTDDLCKDASIIGNILSDGSGFVRGVFGNKIGVATEYDIENTSHSNKLAFVLNNNVFLTLIYYSQYTGCYNNVFDNDCYNNTLGWLCNNNKFGNICYNNILRSDCISNVFGNNCYNNIYSSSCSNNILSNNCYNNTLNTSCKYNILGDNCHDNIIGQYCLINIKDDVNHINTEKGFMRFVTIESGNLYITITSTRTPWPGNELRNFVIASGCNNTSTVITISHNTINDEFKTIYLNVNSTVVNI